MIGICVFSGTGNTLKCAEYMKEKLTALGEECALTRVENGEERLEVLPNTLVIGYPIHGFNMSYNMMNFVKGLPSLKGETRDSAVKVYFLKSSGEPLHANDNSSRAAESILRRKGYDVKGEFHYVMPYNMIFRHTDAFAAKMYVAAKKRIDKDAEIVFRGEERRIRRGFVSKLMSGLCKIVRSGMRLSGRFFKVDGGKCLQCGQCARNCPVQNIKIEDGKFSFGKKCIGCMRCSFLCPTDAFRIGLMDFMRVNGKYDFSADPNEAEICSYCRKAYERYFRETDEKY